MCDSLCDRPCEIIGSCCTKLSESIFHPSNTREENAKIRMQIIILSDVIAFCCWLIFRTHFLMPIAFAVATLGWYLLFQGFDVGAMKYAVCGGLTIVLSIVIAGIMAMKEKAVWNYLYVEIISVVVTIVPLFLQPGGFSYEGVSNIEFNPNYNPNLPGVATAVAVEMM
mmetsp:Transcript_5308/g.7293  ORF Transcript_5308/g.7293 Transcript_5308/m.7293 type:complete len:168 (-) Transcript_5308:454-957(-)